ncbi:hypothetical protein FBZ85_106212 [Azospirillum brasilense]|nr:hypothetical protein FBZ85_106212 [Azospirillum brasilense]
MAQTGIELLRDLYNRYAMGDVTPRYCQPHGRLAN